MLSKVKKIKIGYFLLLFSCLLVLSTVLFAAKFDYSILVKQAMAVFFTPHTQLTIDYPTGKLVVCSAGFTDDSCDIYSDLFSWPSITIKRGDTVSFGGLAWDCNGKDDIAPGYPEENLTSIPAGKTGNPLSNCASNVDYFKFPSIAETFPSIGTFRRYISIQDMWGDYEISQVDVVVPTPAFLDATFTGLHHESNTIDSITWKWNPGTGSEIFSITHYEIYDESDNLIDGNYVTNPGIPFTFNYIGLAVNTDYSIKIRACDAVNVCSDWFGAEGRHRSNPALLNNNGDPYVVYAYTSPNLPIREAYVIDWANGQLTWKWRSGGKQNGYLFNNADNFETHRTDWTDFGAKTQYTLEQGTDFFCGNFLSGYLIAYNGDYKSYGGTGDYTNSISLTINPVGSIMFYCPPVDFNANPRSGETPLAVQFTGPSAALPYLGSIEGTIILPPPTVLIQTWDWELSSLDSSTKQNPSWVYYVPGTYTITLSVTDSRNGYATMTKPDFITVNGPSAPPIISGVYWSFTTMAEPCLSGACEGGSCKPEERQWIGKSCPQECVPDDDCKPTPLILKFWREILPKF